MRKGQPGSGHAVLEASEGVRAGARFVGIKMMKSERPRRDILRDGVTSGHRFRACRGKEQAYGKAILRPILLSSMAAQPSHCCSEM